ncbi:MAG: hypothetical protein JO261_10505 [Alphaproteobacteria bacterium]|nr:hypothetical protein [Alphaproteobacteria bacterium]MBV9694116.1 hypothetical protein [Alphaproteobacteria bacterium]
MVHAAEARTPTRPRLVLEQQLYERSGLGMVGTSALVFVLLFGSFLACAAAEHVTIVDVHRTFGLSDAAWPALVVSLLCTAPLAMQRYVRLADIRDAPMFAQILRGGVGDAFEPPSRARMLRATLIGLACGIVLSIVIRLAEFREGHVIPPATMAWFAAATTLLSLLFARGVTQTRAGERVWEHLLKERLRIDLLRVDRLAVLGRAAARTSLIWFVVGAVACLFFVGGDLTWLTALLLLATVGMGLGTFMRAMGRIHRLIAAAKAQELEHIRSRIEEMREALMHDDHAAARLHGLIAYETRIAQSPEWPFDQSTLVRVGAYVLIPVIPWFGQAIVQYLVEHLAR